MFSTRLRRALVLQTTNLTSVLATRKCHGKLQQRWMEDIIFHLSLSDFSQVSLSNYLTEFHIDYWTIVEVQIPHFISSRQVGLLCFIQFFPCLQCNLVLTHSGLYGAREPVLTKSHRLYFRVEKHSACFLVWKSAFEQELRHWKCRTET